MAIFSADIRIRTANVIPDRQPYAAVNVGIACDDSFRRRETPAIHSNVAPPGVLDATWCRRKYELALGLAPLNVKYYDP
jgi:hypothetical protein